VAYLLPDSKNQTPLTRIFDATPVPFPFTSQSIIRTAVLRNIHDLPTFLRNSIGHLTVNFADLSLDTGFRPPVPIDQEHEGRQAKEKE
jgi:hypothetical protein